MIAAALVGVAPSVVAGASGAALTTNSDWHTVATLSDSMMGLAGDANGNLIAFDRSKTLSSIPASGLAGALTGSPVASSAITTLAQPSDSVGDWIAGIVPLPNGTTLFNTGSANVISLESAPGVWSPAYSNGWLMRPQGMARDPQSGALYVALSSVGKVYRVPAAGSSFDWANAVEVADGLAYPTSIQVDGHGDVFVADLIGQSVYELAANTISSVVGGSPPASPGSGLVTLASGSELSEINGLAIDAQGDLFFTEYYGYSLPGGGVLTVGEIPARWIATSSQPATLENGGLVDVADTLSTPAVDEGLQPAAVVNGVLYVGSWTSDNIYAYRVSTVARVTNLAVTLTGGNLIATWAGTAGTGATCTLMYGFNSPSSVTQTTSSGRCVFYNVGHQPYGVRVTPIGGNTTSSVTVFASPTTITCVRGRTVRHVTGFDPVCPAHFRRR